MRLYPIALKLYFMKTRVSKLSGRSDGRSFWINFPILNSLSDAVEVGGGLRKTLESELRRGNFVAFSFQKLSGFCLMLLLLDFIKSLSSRVASSRSVAPWFCLRPSCELSESERMELKRSLAFFSESSCEACETWKIYSKVKFLIRFLYFIIAALHFSNTVTYTRTLFLKETCLQC